MANQPPPVDSSVDVLKDEQGIKPIWSGWFNFLFNWMNNITAITASFSSYVRPGTPAASSQTVLGIYAGSGAPSNTNGQNGDIYLRSDGGALTTIYQKRSGTWTGIV